jgi:excisionase family DNA binding protein
VKAFYRVSEVGEILNLGRTKTYQLIRSGAIPSVKIDGNIRVPAKPLHDWIDAQIARGKERSLATNPLAYVEGPS